MLMFPIWSDRAHHVGGYPVKPCHCLHIFCHAEKHATKQSQSLTPELCRMLPTWQHNACRPKSCKAPCCLTTISASICGASTPLRSKPASLAGFLLSMCESCRRSTPTDLTAVQAAGSRYCRPAGHQAQAGLSTHKWNLASQQSLKLAVEDGWDT